MSLFKRFVRNGKGIIIGSTTAGYTDTQTIVRDAENKILGRTSERFHTTRDSKGVLISRSTADPGLLIKK